ncbi:transcriptional activator RfaH [Alishewanella aestuarii B11]|uniref:Transcriptional activator RfaH n=1 Tax=Alishewanella aestuarii B11 TaxID=1197174 RepID=J2IG38_9ALTE|nr:transcription/translation regulatory transformer protein RfaH [Alishewanella aestuarii]EJI85729.1 transcriptional activator RfaH [Alishewanella aestuarii B11]
MDNWYLIYSKSQQEQRAQQHLANQGFESFAPQITVKKIRAGKTVQLTEPLFPRYIFLKCPQTPNLSTIRSTRGVAGLVRFGDKLATVPSSLINHLLKNQLELQQQMPVQPFQPGDKLEILNGPFANLNAVFQQADGEQRSIILLNFLGQQLQLSLENKDLSKPA